MNRRRVVSPKIVQSRSGGWRVALVLLILIAIGAALAAGLLLGRNEASAFAARTQEIEAERDLLAEELAKAKQEAIVLERTKQIDVEANKTAQEELKRAQDERLALDKEVSFLKRLFQEGGGGIAQVQAFRLVAGEETNEYVYSFTVSQLIQDFGESEGQVEIKVAGKHEGKESTLPVDKLPGSEPTEHKMKFKHFQNFEGRLVIPDDFEPENLVVDIKPSTKNLLRVTETFGWDVVQ